MNKKTKIITFSVFGGVALGSVAFLTPIVTSCSNQTNQAQPQGLKNVNHILNQLFINPIATSFNDGNGKGIYLSQFANSSDILNSLETSFPKISEVIQKNVQATTGLDSGLTFLNDVANKSIKMTATISNDENGNKIAKALTNYDFDKIVFWLKTASNYDKLFKKEILCVDLTYTFTYQPQFNSNNGMLFSLKADAEFVLSNYNRLEPIPFLSSNVLKNAIFLVYKNSSSLNVQDGEIVSLPTFPIISDAIINEIAMIYKNIISTYQSVITYKKDSATIMGPNDSELVKNLINQINDVFSKNNLKISVTKVKIKPVVFYEDKAYSNCDLYINFEELFITKDSKINLFSNGLEGYYLTFNNEIVKQEFALNIPVSNLQLSSSILTTIEKNLCVAGNKIKTKITDPNDPIFTDFFTSTDELLKKETNDNFYLDKLVIGPVNLPAYELNRPTNIVIGNFGLAISNKNPDAFVNLSISKIYNNRYVNILPEDNNMVLFSMIPTSIPAPTIISSNIVNNIYAEMLTFCNQIHSVDENMTTLYTKATTDGYIAHIDNYLAKINPNLKCLGFAILNNHQYSTTIPLSIKINSDIELEQWNNKLKVEFYGDAYYLSPVNPYPTSVSNPTNK